MGSCLWTHPYDRMTRDQIYVEGQETWSALDSILARGRELRESIDHIERDEIGDINHQIEALRLKERSLALDGGPGSASAVPDPALQRRLAELEGEYRKRTARLEELYRDAAQYQVGLTISDGREIRIPLAQVIGVSRPNDMGWGQKVFAYVGNLWGFLSGEPREANTEGGIFPAIFGTVLLVFLMTIVVMPFGVMAAVYLREYAKQGMLVRIVRIAVNNLAGVPSIVFGVFGLGCFIYAAGGTIDRLFFPESLAQSDVWNRRDSLGLSDLGAPDGSRRHRGHRRGPLRSPTRVSRRIDRLRRHEIRNDLACDSALRPPRNLDRISFWRWPAQPAKSRRSCSPAS